MQFLWSTSLYVTDGEICGRPLLQLNSRQASEQSESIEDLEGTEHGGESSQVYGRISLWRLNNELQACTVCVHRTGGGQEGIGSLSLETSNSARQCLLYEKIGKNSWTLKLRSFSWILSKWTNPVFFFGHPLIGNVLHTWVYVWV